jgi:hypothetical protein
MGGRGNEGRSGASTLNKRDHRGDEKKVIGSRSKATGEKEKGKTSAQCLVSSTRSTSSGITAVSTAAH